MKILVLEICNYVDYPTGGQLTFVRNMIAGFGENLLLVGCTTDPATPCGKWTELDVDGRRFPFFSVMRFDPDIEKPVIPKRVSAFVALRRNMKRILDIEYDTVFIQSPEVLFALPKSVLPKTRIDLPGVSNPLSQSRYRFLRPLSNAFRKLFLNRLKSLDRIWATASSSEIRKFVNDSPLQIENVTQLPTRYDSRLFKPVSRGIVREKLSLPGNAHIFVTVGRLNRNKGWKLMLKAFEHCQYGDNSMFFIIGNGEDYDIILNEIRFSGLEKNVFLLGKQSSETISDYLNAADVFIMGSLFEGWSTTLVEACACGVPCVVTDFSSASDMIKDGKNGYVIKDFDESSFAEGMIAALKLDRGNVIDFDSQYERLSIQHLFDEMYGDMI